MKKTWKKVLSVVLSFAMVLASITVSEKGTNAADSYSVTSVTENLNVELANMTANTYGQWNNLVTNQSQAFITKIGSSNPIDKIKDRADDRLADDLSERAGENDGYIVDLGQMKDIKEMILNFSSAAAISYEVSLSVNGTDYIPVAYVNFEGAAVARVDKITLTDVQSARYIKLYFYVATTPAYLINLREFSAFGGDNTNQPIKGVGTSSGETNTDQPSGPVTSDVKAPTKLYVQNYGKYTGKYFVVFTPAENAKSYNIYVGATFVKNVSGSGYYITSEELTALNIANGTYTLSVKSVDAQGGESAAVTGQIKIENRGHNDDIPQVYISTQGRNIGTEYFKKTDGNVSVNVAIIDNSGTYKEIIDVESDIKIRGNSTAYADKKPYNIKLGKKQAVLGMDSEKKWSLLANAFDKSLIRNALVTQLAHEMGLPYTSDCKFVDIYCNGEYLGNYLAIESIDVGTGRIEIDSENPANSDILLELDNSRRDATEVYYLKNTSLGIAFMLGSPEIEPNDYETIATYQDKINKVERHIAEFEQALRDNDFEAIQEYIDVDSFAKFYVLNEYFRNQDINFSSTRFHMKDGKIYAGPCWDNDLSSGNLGSYYGNEEGMNSVNKLKAVEMEWYKYLMKNDEFRAYVAQIYQQYLPNIKGIYTTYIDKLIQDYGKSFERNFASKANLGAGWSITNPDGGDAYSYANARTWNSYTEAVEYLREWLNQRNLWLIDQWNVDDPSAPCSIILNDEGQVAVRWNYTGTGMVNHYEIAYTSYDMSVTPPEEKRTAEKTITANAEDTSIVISDVIDNNTKVTVTAVLGNGIRQLVGSATALADLKVTKIYFTNASSGAVIENPVEGDFVKVNLEVSNIGTAAAYPTTDRIASGTYIDGDKGNKWTNEYRGPLAPGKIADYNFSPNVVWTVEAGIHVISGEIDDRNLVVEKSKDNNRTDVSFTFDNKILRPTSVTTTIIDNRPMVNISAAGEQAAAGYTYDIYIDGIYYKNVKEAGSYDLGAMTPGIHTVTVYSVLGGEKSIAVSAKITIAEEVTEPEETIYKNSIVEFKYDSTDVSIGEDMNEYAYNDDTYTYYATAGAGTMQGSVNGQNLKHFEWGDSADYGKIVPIMAASKNEPNLWTADAYIAYSFSTIGFTEMKGSVEVAGTKKGPQNLLVGYYEGGTFIPFAEYSIPKNKTFYTIDFELPQALENQDNVTVYVKLKDTINIGGNEMTSEEYRNGGEIAINNFVIYQESEEVKKQLIGNVSRLQVTGGAGSATATWNAPEGVSCNAYLYNDEGRLIDIQTNVSSYSNTNLEQGKTYTLKVTTVLGGVETAGITATIQIAMSSQSIAITGFQMSATLGANNDEIGLRTIYQKEQKVKGQNVTALGLVYALDIDEANLTDDIITVDSYSAYVSSNQATDVGKIDAQMGDSVTADYYAMTMPIGEGYHMNYKVRPYVVLEDGSIVYGEVRSYNVYEIALSLYNNNKMSTATAHQRIFDQVIKKVDPDATEVEYNWNKTLVNQPEKGNTDVNIEGYQMSTALGGIQGNMGLRIVYSVEGTYEEVGLIYGLVYGDNPITDKDMEVGSESEYIVNYEATELGKQEVNFGTSAAAYYAQTMEISGTKENDYYTTKYLVRAYAKTADGNIVYSDVFEYTIENVAAALYQNNLMNTYAAHEALYTYILSRLDTVYDRVDYKWAGNIVK